MRGVYKRKKIYYISFGYKGKRFREPAGPNFELARNLLVKRKSEVIENFNKRIKDPTCIGFSSFADLYLEEHCKVHNKSSKQKENVLKQFKVFFGQKQLDDITVNDVEEYQGQMIKKHLANGTVNKHLSMLKHMYNLARKRWNFHIGQNPTENIKKLPETNERTRYLTQEEFKNLFNALNSDIQKVLIFAVNMGMRKGEIRGLKWNQVNLEQRFVQLKASSTKTDKPRELPINDAALAVLNSLKGNSAEWVFADEKGGRYGDWKKAFSNGVKKAKIEDFRFHDTRHTFASWLLMTKKVGLFTVQELLGHTDPKMTRRYSHLSMQHKHDAVQELSAVNSTIAPQAAKKAGKAKSNRIVNYSNSRT